MTHRRHTPARHWWNRVAAFPGRLYRLNYEIGALRQQLEDEAIERGRLHSRVNSLSPAQTLADVEFKVSSQYGDDGIIDHLIQRVRPPIRRFVEFGVDTYSEANTRFLLQSRNWSGLIIDGRHDLAAIVRADPIFRRHDLTVRSAFVTAENINRLLTDGGMQGPIGLLSIDIDGNDYWVWKAISVVAPAIVVSEFNSVFGSSHPWTIPYDPSFDRTTYHFSNLVYGSSLTSLCDLAVEKGYSFVGCNSAGNNAYFVKNEFLGDLRAHEPEEGYVQSTFSESRDQHRAWTYLKGDERLRSIAGAKVFNTRTGSIEEIR